ncbi:hypothetical protein SNOG_05870 [Parastagonospora nodorum SN15]|uniref:Uncharacterized protein n=2 Tax=Phaeosphaeria nodorum (strain SN15 / ATCC MYA-4574 / FGSC 10173) TaxID=321614 RepID=Q0UQU4_PHANO|nr:hypothetical protein SNOG_05870 [Parastagonospora nodorum SN15]EAT86934.2 hypothetical protein SNOG_05870 [Parastagonospora nodorum SN15]
MHLLRRLIFQRLPKITTKHRRHADLREDSHRQDHHAGGRVIGHNRQCEEQDPGQGGHSPGPAAPDLRRKATRGWPHPVRLQHPEGVDSALGPPSPWRHHRAFAQGARLQVQLRQDDLPQVLRSSATEGCQLPQEEVRPHQPAPPQEEAQVNASLPTASGESFGVMWRYDYATNACDGHEGMVSSLALSTYIRQHPGM